MTEVSVPVNKKKRSPLRLGFPGVASWRPWEVGWRGWGTTAGHRGCRQVISLLLPQFLSSSHGKGAGWSFLGTREKSMGSYWHEGLGHPHCTRAGLPHPLGLGKWLGKGVYSLSSQGAIGTARSQSFNANN